MIENLRNLLLNPLRKGAVLLSLLLCSGSILAQTLVTGTVTDVSGETLPGVSILIEGTTKGTVTDANGQFSLEVPNSSSRLSVSYVGFTSKVVDVEDSPLSIMLEVDVQSLEEVVVVGYGTMKKSDLTGSVGQLSADELNSQPITTMEQGLQGRIAGVKITTSSGAPGGGMSVQIRGVTSILNGSEPLYVIDGFPVSGQSQFSTNSGRGTSAEGADYTVNQNPLAAINPADIQSIEVLKDASAAAIYGVRGANGVILITTKRGQTGAPKLSYSGYVGVQSVSKKVEMMDAQGYQDLYNENSANNIVNGVPTPGPPVFTEAPPYDTDWQDQIFRQAVIQNHQVSVSGGTKAVQYLISGSYFDQEGIIKGSNFNRYSLRLNLDVQATERLKIGTSTNISRVDNDAVETEGEVGGSVTQNALRHSPILPVFNPDGSYTSHDQLPNNVPEAEGDSNPVADINERTDESITNRILSTVFAEYAIIPDLKFKVSVGTDIESRDRRIYTTVDKVTSTSTNSAVVSNVDRASFLNENTLNYNKDFGNQNIQVLAGFTAQREIEKFGSITARDFATDITTSYNLSGGSVEPSVNSRYGEFSIASFLGRVNYNLDDRYLLTATIRRDGSSKFAAGNKWATFPSVGAAWNISNESFATGATDVFNNMKVRLGWGQTGNQELAAYRSLALLRSDPYNWGGSNVNGFAPRRIEVGDLTWEITTMTNLGIDVSVFKSRLNFTFDYYNKQTKDLLLEVQLPNTSGITEPSIQNLGEMENVGFELTMDGLLVETNNLSWELGFNFSKNNNKITSLGSPEEIGEDADPSYLLPRTTFSGSAPTSYVTVGESFGVFYGYKTDGLYRSDAEANDPLAQQLKPNTLAGDIKYVDTDGDGDIDADDRTVIGNPHPDFIYGFNTNLKYSNLTLRLFFQGQEGGVVYNAMRAFNSGINRGANMIAERADYWTPENPDAVWPTPRDVRSPTRGGGGIMGESDFFLEDASYLRMREITLNFDFPREFLGDLTGSVYVTGQNLLTITGYNGYNPDTNARANVRGAFGYDISSYPLAKTFLLGLKLQF
ncbi:MAG: TonB-dependent receptor [Cyclobacteriaceae bacterium]